MASLSSVLGFDDSFMLNPIWDIKDNLILTKNRSVYAVYQVSPKIINTVDDEAKEKFKNLVYSSLANLRKYNNYKIKMLPFNQDLFSKFKVLSQDIDWDSGVSDLAEYILQGQIEMLEQSIGTLFDYRYYLIVPLRSIHISMDLKDVLNQSYRKTVSKTLALVGLGEEMPSSWDKEYKNQREILDNALNLLNIRPLKTDENYFLNRKHFLKGQNYNENFEIELVKNSIENIDDTNVEFENVNIIKLTNFDEVSYVSTLAVNSVPQNMSYLHLQEELQTLKFPVEVDYNCQFSLPKGVFSLMAKARRARGRLKNTMNEAEETDDVQNTKVMRSRYLLEDMQSKFDEDEPMLSYLQTITVTGNSIDELKERYEVLYAYATQMGIELVRANADQLYLFYKNRLTEMLDSQDRNFIQPMSLEAFCENLFFITRKVGTDIGFCIGRVDNQFSSWQGDYKSAIESSANPVYTNLLQANKLNVRGKTTSNPHVAIIGETGSGKSFLTKLLFSYHSLLKSQILYIDPKAEMREQYQLVLEKHKKAGTFPELQKYIESIDFVTLDAKNPDNYGALDPIVFLRGQEASDLADSMIDSLLGKDNTPLIQEGYLEAVDKVLAQREAGEKVGMINVFDLMIESDREDISNSGKLLKRLVNNSILSLCFSDGSNEAISLTNKVTILEITGLDLPKETETVGITKSQKKSLIVMYALGYFCKRFGERDRKQETILFFDEAWFFNSTSVGKSILMELKRIGRSFNNFMVYITQSVKDLETSDDSTGFGTVFAFLEKTEIDDVLDYLKVVKTEKTREWIGNMTMAQCIYFDTFGRKERITVDGMFPEITELFDTVKTDLKAV